VRHTQNGDMLLSPLSNGSRYADGQILSYIPSRWAGRPTRVQE